MTTRVDKTLVVNVPVSTAYNQWTQFEDFPQFMSGVQEVRQLDDRRLHWVAEIAGVRREWEARIVDQVPDQVVSWAATQGATNAGAVSFRPAGADQTAVTLTLEYEPEGLVEKAGDALNIVGKQAEGDLQRFKAFIESADRETGAWRGRVGEGVPAGAPDVSAAGASQGDSGKAGLSGKVVAGAAAAAVGVAAAAVTAAKRSGESDEDATPATPTAPPVSTAGRTDVPHSPIVTSDAPAHVSGDAMATGTGSLYPEEEKAAEAVRDEGRSS